VGLIAVATAAGVVGATAVLAVAAALWVALTVYVLPDDARPIARLTWWSGRAALIVGLGAAVLSLAWIALFGVGRLALWLGGAR